MHTADFLFPRDLEVSQTSFNKVLFIGSCLSRDYVIKLRSINPDTIYDYILFNNSSDLPEKNLDEVTAYDFQYIQIPLRSVLTDAVVRIADNDKSKNPINWLELGKQNIDAMLDKALSYNSSGGLLTFVSNFIVPQGRVAPSLLEQDSDNDLIRVIRELNHYLSAKLRTYKNAYIADVDMIANSLGKKYFLDDTVSFYTHGALFYTDWSGHERTPYWTAPGPGRIEEIPDLRLTYENKNDEFFDAVYQQMTALYRTVHQIDMVKLVVFDLDNTLWRGQLIEHYQPGVQWPYSDGWPLGLWETVHHLVRRGIVVTIASKNDEALVIKKWDDAVQPSFIKYSDFLDPKINWNSKSENIKSILEQLSLTPKSVVFVDDNPIERESVKAALPGMRVLGSDPFVVRRILLWSPETQVPMRSNESKHRADMLKSQIGRESQKAAMSRSDFLASLNSNITIWEISDSSHPSFTRAHELVNKTNQFNTNGNRWSFEECENFFLTSGKIFAFSVVDKYTSYGTVGVVFVRQNVIVQFVMSCRVLGMEVEVAALAKITELMRIEKFEIHASIIETESNTPCRNLYSISGFTNTHDGNFILAQDKKISIPGHITVKKI